MPRLLVSRPLPVAVFVWALTALTAPLSTLAQATEEASLESSGFTLCSKPTVAQSSNPITRDLRTEFRDLYFDVCRVSEDYKEGGFGGMLERQFGTIQDLVVDLFVGRGLHPTIGSIVPEGGIAFGAALNNEWHLTETPRTRFTTSVEARAAPTTGFWAAGAMSNMQFDWYRAYDTGSFRMPQITVAVKYFDLPEMPFFGLGNQTSLDNRSLFELTETVVPILIDFPVAYGLTLSGQVTGLYATSDPSAKFSSVFSESSAPGIRSRTTYVVPGVIATYRSLDVLDGLSGEARLSYEAYQAVSGGSYTFDRFEARAAVHYGIQEQPLSQGMLRFVRSLLGSSRFTAEANLVISDPRTNNAVPFYLQPTVGGGDIHNENWLRSYTNYRFRAPNTVAYGLSYDRRIVDPLGFTIFGQWAKVGQTAGDLDFDGLKHSVGFGLSVRLGGRAVAEFSIAWGGGEGSHAYTAGNTNNAIGFGARAAGTVGLRGVF